MNKANWQRLCIKDLCESIIDCVNKTAPVVDYPTDYKMIRTTNVKSGWINLTEVKYVTEETYQKWTRRAVPRKGDVILTREAPLGEVGMLRSDDKVFLGQRLVQYRVNPQKLDNRFLLYAFQEADLQSQIKSFGSGSTVEHMRVPDCEKLTLLLPPLPTQKRIADILSAYDRLIENNTQRIKILEEMAQLLYHEWFVNFRFPGYEKVSRIESELGLIPQGWEVGKLEEALFLQRGFDLPTKQRKEGSVPVYASTGIVGTHSEAKIKAPGVVTGRSGSLGTVMYVNKDFWALNTTLWVKEFRRVTPIYAFYLLSSLGLEQFNSGAAVPTLNRNDIHVLPIILPPSYIIQEFDRYVQAWFDLKDNLSARNENLRKTRDLLLPKLISGEVDVDTIESSDLEAIAA